MVLEFFFTFCHKGGVICISEVIDIFASNLDSSCASSSPALRMMYSAYKLNNQGDNIQSWHLSFPIWNQSATPRPGLTVASWPAYICLRRQVRWSCIPISWRIFPFVVIHSQRPYCNKWSRIRCLSGILFFCLWSNDVSNLMTTGSSDFSFFNFKILLKI